MVCGQCRTNLEVGHDRQVDEEAEHTCEVCDGRRLNPHALKVTYAGLPIDAFNELPLDELLALLTRTQKCTQQTAHHQDRVP